MKTIIMKLDIIIDIADTNVSASQKSMLKSVPEEMNELNSAVDVKLKAMGFHLIGHYDDDPSIRNGGWAFYNSYKLIRDDNQIKLIIAIRTANHPSKPNLVKKNENRMKGEVDIELRRKLKQEGYDLDLNDVELMDSYYDTQKSDVRYFLGKGDEYSDPVYSLDKFINYLGQRVVRLINKH